MLARRRCVRAGLWGLALFALVACADDRSAKTDIRAAIAEVQSREIIFPDYPKPNTTYLSFSQAHGFQVNYIAPGNRAWLWYPGNSRALPETYKLDTLGANRILCWRHPDDSYNPVTQQRGGDYSCSLHDLAKRTIIAALPGDAYGLSRGTVPYARDRCDAPAAFEFDRARFRC